MKQEITSSPRELARTRSVWHKLGTEDPLWAVATCKGQRGNRWQMEEFLATGERDIALYRGLLARHTSAPARFTSVLDFGCGVGRLSRLWLRHADRVVGVDISAPMLEQARKIVGDDPKMTFLLNETCDLASCGSAQFDLVFSHICLQHMPWSLASDYLREFVRVCQPRGWVVFQLPARELMTIPGLCARMRRCLVDRLPFGLGATWRKWRHGTSVIFDMFYTPPQDVRATAAAAGLAFCHAEPSQAAGDNTEGFIYIFRKG